MHNRHTMTNYWIVRFGGREFSYCTTESMNKLVQFCINQGFAVEVLLKDTDND